MKPAAPRRGREAAVAALMAGRRADMEREAKHRARLPAPRARMATPQAEAPVVIRKEQPFRSKTWLAAVRTLPCVFCGAPVQAAHRNEGKGLAMKTDDSLAAAICQAEHAEIDQGKDLTQAERRARMDRAIVLTLRELARRGLLVIKAAA